LVDLLFKSLDLDLFCAELLLVQCDIQVSRDAIIASIGVGEVALHCLWIFNEHEALDQGRVVREV